MRDFILSLTVIATSTPALSQELALDFIDELDFEFTQEAAPSSLEISTVLGLSYSGIGTLSQTVAAQINIANQHDLGNPGFLEWAGNIALPDVENGDVSFNLSRIHLQNSDGDLSWKLGKYRIGWGEVEGAPVLDVINASLSLGAALPSDELPGQWFLGADYFANATTISSFVGLAPEVSHTIPTASSADIEIGSKALIPIESGAISLYAAQLVPQSGIIDPGSGLSQAAPYTLAAISTNKSYGNLLVEFDVAGKFGLQRNNLTTLSKHDRIDTAFGVEYAASGSMQVSASVIAQHWLEQAEDYYELGGFISPQTSASYMFGISDAFLDGKLSLSANMLGTIDNNTNVKALSATYSYSDGIKLGVSAMWMEAQPGTQMEALDGFTQYGLTSTFYF